ncbi:MAG: DUF2142 domain-containing protein [Christensenella sp.]|nr:DUF2142 domain-containing protein [Christensenella sp.]
MKNHFNKFFCSCKQAIPKDYWKQRIFFIVLLALICIGFAYLNAPHTAYGEITPAPSAEDRAGEAFSPLLNNTVLAQNFTYVGDAQPSMIGFEMDDGGQDVSAKYTAQLLSADGSLLCQIDFNGDAAKQPLYMGLPAGFDARGQQLTLQITTQADSISNALMPVTTTISENAPALTLNGQAANASLSLTFGTRYISTDLWALCMIIMICGVACICLWTQSLSRNFLIIGLIFGVIFCLITPIMDTPDEQLHFSKSLMMAGGEWFPTAGGGNQISTSYNDVYANFQNTLANTTLGGLPVSTQTQYSDLGSSMLFLNYLPQALGIGIAKLFSLGILPAFYLGRICNLLLYVILAWLAVKTVKKYKLFLTIAALMPMALYISGSYNPDAFVYGFALLMASYFINLYFDRSQKIGWKNILIFAALCVLVCIKKYNYAPFLFLLLFIPKERFVSHQTKYLGQLAVFAIVAAVIFATFYATTQSLAGSSDALVEGGVNAVGANMFDQLRFTLANPGAVLSMLINKITLYFGGTLQQLFLFGWMEYATPDIISILYFCFLAVVGLCYTRYEYQEENTLGATRVSAINRIGILLVMLAIAVISYVMMYLTWTSVGALDIWGMQGRYLVPALFLLPFLGQNTAPLVKRDTYERSVYSILFAAMMFLVFSAFSTVIQYY